MLLSMTGFGEAHLREEAVAVTVEVRSINSRYFKLSVRANEGYGVLEPEIEHAVRKRIRRGTIQVMLWVDRHRPEDFHINVDVLEGYRRQLESVHKRWHVAETVNIEQLLTLPGVIDDARRNAADVQEDWPLVARVLNGALDKLEKMRQSEGSAMAADLSSNIDAIESQIESIAERAPVVVEAYRERLRDRVSKALEQFDVKVDASDMIREVSLFADRSDISEELVRLRSHLDQFRATLELDESSGRKLEFLTQEMFRETNTVGSKANDVEIARHVIEIKAAIEKIREMIQNVE